MWQRYRSIQSLSTFQNEFQSLHKLNLFVVYLHKRGSKKTKEKCLLRRNSLELSFSRLIVVPLSIHDFVGVRKENERLTAILLDFISFHLGIYTFIIHLLFPFLFSQLDDLGRIEQRMAKL